MLKVEEGGEDGVLHGCFVVIPTRYLLCNLQLPSTLLFHGQSLYSSGKASEMLSRAAEGSPGELLSHGLLRMEELALEKAAQEDKAVFFLD